MVGSGDVEAPIGGILPCLPGAPQGNGRVRAARPTLTWPGPVCKTRSMDLLNRTLRLSVSIVALAGLWACESEEPAQPVPVEAEQAAPVVDEKPAPEPVAAAPEAAPEKPTSDEPGALTAFADVDESEGSVPLTVQLDVDIIPGTGNPPFTYVWDFGDATEFANEKAPQHTYEVPGSFRATVIVTDSKGETDQDYYDITVQPAPAAAAPKAEGDADSEEAGALTAFADVDESDGDVPLTVQLDVDVIPGTGTPPFTYVWDFGDATEFSTEKAPKHTYEVPGSFRASVIVTDSKGNTDQDYYDISASEPMAEGAVTAEQLLQMLPADQQQRIRKALDGQVPAAE